MALKRRLKILGCDTEAQEIEETGFRVAFASTDMKTVDQHFGYAESFAIYALNMEESKLIEVSQYGDMTPDANEDKLQEKLDILKGCIAVYSIAVGASAVRQLKALGIQPVKVTAGKKIEELLLAIQNELRAGPATWLARAIDAQRSMNPSNFDAMEKEGWEE